MIQQPDATQPLLQTPNQIWKFRKHYLWQNIIFPFAVTRFVLVLAAWFAGYFPRNGHYNYSDKSLVLRGWQFSPHRIIDIWGRWDTAWYLDIVRNGYSFKGDVQSIQSNIAFFPLYPYLVRCFTYLVPTQWRTPGIVLLIGIILSNLLLLGALILLHKLITTSLGSKPIASRTILYLLVFPTSFFFSSFYTESAFLFLSIATFYAASRKTWWLAGVLGGLLALARPLGVVVIVPLFWMYMEQSDWQLNRIRWNIIYLLLIPTGFLVFQLYLYNLTGVLLASVQIQAAWKREFVMPWVTLLHPKSISFITPIDRLTVIGFIFLGVLSVRLLRTRGLSYSIYTFCLLLPPLFSGRLMSIIRYYLVVFPIFIVMAMIGERKEIHQFFVAVFFALLILFMAAWSQFYWIA